MLKQQQRNLLAKIDAITQSAQEMVKRNAASFPPPRHFAIAVECLHAQTTRGIGRDSSLHSFIYTHFLAVRARSPFISRCFHVCSRSKCSLNPL